MERPLVSILMPVYNREKFIGEAIESVIQQSFKEWELIIIDDNSSDNTIKCIQIYKDPRIKILNKTVNQGVARALNDGISVSKGEFIGRLDSDDIAVNNRIEKQVRFLKNNKEVDICGSWIRMLDSGRILKFSENHSSIVSELLLYSPIGGASILARREVFEKFSFNNNLRFGEDYEFWSRALFHFRAYNLQEPLLFYRSHENQLTKNVSSTNHFDVRIKFSILNRLSYDQKKFPEKLIFKFLTTQSGYTKADIINYLEWTEEIQSSNDNIQLFPRKEFYKVINRLRGKMLEEIYFRTSPGIDKYMRLQLLSKLKWSEMTKLYKRKIGVKSINW